MTTKRCTIPTRQFDLFGSETLHWKSPAPSGKQRHSNSICTFPMNRRSTSLFDFLDAEVDEPTTIVTPHAIQNHRSRTTRKPASIERKAKGQQLLTFDDGDDRNPTTNQSLAVRGADAQSTSGRIGGDDSHSGPGVSDQSTPATSAHSGNQERPAGNHRRSNSTDITQHDDRVNLVQAIKFEAHPLFAPAVQQQSKAQRPLAAECKSMPLAPASSGEKTKARDIIQAIETLARLKKEDREPTESERQTLLIASQFEYVSTK